MSNEHQPSMGEHSPSHDSKENLASVDGIDGVSYYVNVIFPNSDACKIQVSSGEIVQEIHRALMEREESCHRTCFSLHFNDQTLDLFTDLKSIEGLEEGSEIRVVEERYTTREVRNHVKHVLEILNSIKLRDAYAGREQMSLSFLSSVTLGDILERKPNRSDPSSLSFLPPSYIMPAGSNSEPPLVPLHPISKEDNDLDCLQQLNYSNWNPPPSTRRLAGDLLYLVVHTLEGKRCHITACPRGFYVNQTTDEGFNPAPVQNACVMHSLVDLLKQLSPAFKKSYDTLLKRRANKHPFERLPTPYQVYSWLTPNWQHTLDSVRKEESLTSRMAWEENLPGQTRDWNDELQATRELPQNDINEQLMRDRAVFKSNCDFVAASTRAAVNVINGEIVAINPGEKRKQQMFIWNNMFFSLGFDVKDHYKDLGGNAAAYSATSCDLNGVRAYSTLDQSGLCTLGTALIDYRGYRVTAQTIIPGILEKEQEQLIVYGSNDFGKTVVDDGRYTEILSKSAKPLRIRPHKVLDKSNKMVNILSSVDCKGIVGNDNRTYLLDLLNTFPPDVNYLGGAPASVRPVLSETMRKLGYPYTHRHLLPSVRQELVDSFCDLRQEELVRKVAEELQKIRTTSQTDAEKEEARTEEEKEVRGPSDDVNGVLLLNADSAAKSVQQLMLQEKGFGIPQHSDNVGTIPIPKIRRAMTEGADDPDLREAMKRAAQSIKTFKNGSFEILFNSDAFKSTVTFAKEEEENLKRDRELIQEICEFLVLQQIPSFIEDCLSFAVIPQDGRALVEILHQRGINVRYLNRIVEELKDKPTLAYLHRLVVCEIVVRSAKHLFKPYIQGVDPMFVSAAVAHFLNCLLTACPSLQPLAGVDEVSIYTLLFRNNGREGLQEMAWLNETAASFWVTLNKEVKEYYHIDLELSDVDTFCQTHSVTRTQILRSFCQAVGIQLVLHEYALLPPNGARHHSRPVFSLEDVVSIYPLVKHLHPYAFHAYRYFTSGQKHIAEGFLQRGSELISEALNLLNTVYGPLHPDIGACNRLLARLSYVMGDHQTALLYQQRATMISERVHGIDSPSTAAEYIHMALYCFACGHVSIAFQLLYRARYLALLCHGEIHPEIAQIDVNISLMLHAVEEYDTSITFLENALKLNKIFYGEKSLKEAFNAHLLSRTHAYRGDFRSALDCEKRRYAIYLERFGENSEYTRDSNECLHTLTQQAVNVARQLQKPLGASRNMEVLNGNGKTKKMAATFGLGQTLPTPNFVTILDTLNRVNGIFYVHLNPPVGISRGDGGRNGLSSQEANTVQISPAEDDANSPKPPVGVVVSANKVHRFGHKGGKHPSCAGLAASDASMLANPSREICGIIDYKPITHRHSFFLEKHGCCLGVCVWFWEEAL
ncbi:Protein clueles [Taenia solium]|eukprot:TsM_000309500 transcript=TsM_000309500 gene=TsM_000309500